MKLYNDPYLKPNETLLSKITDLIKYDAIVSEDNSILMQMAPIILQIINSNETTCITKNYAIEFLDAILPYYTFSQITKVFNEDLLARALDGNDNLQRVVAKILEKADVSKLCHGSLFLKLFEIFADPNTELATACALEKTIIAWTLKSDEIRQKYLNDPNIEGILNDMGNNKIVQSRCISLMIDILPVVPALPSSRYLITENELAKRNDFGLYLFCISSWQNLLQAINANDNLRFLQHEIEPEMEFCSKKFVGLKTLIEFDDISSVNVLVTLSTEFPEYFKILDKKYNLVDYACTTYTKYEKSLLFLRSLDLKYTESHEALYTNFTISERYVDLFCYYLSDDDIVKNKLTIERFPQSKFDKLTFDNLFKILERLTTSNVKIEILLDRWPNILTRVLGRENLNNYYRIQLLDVLNMILNSTVPLGKYEDPILQKIEQLRGSVSAANPLTESL